MSYIFADFPKNQADFVERFATEEACRDHLVKVKWPNGFSCPCQVPDPSGPGKTKVCGNTVGWRLTNREIWVCSACEYHCSLRVGTLFQKSKKPLKWWFLALYHVTASKQGISAKEFQRVMGISKYQTAWDWLQKIRDKMKPAVGESKLHTEVEVDEVFMGGYLEGGKPGVGSENKTKIAVAVEKQGKRLGRVRFRVIPDRTAATLCSFVMDFVEKGSIVITDYNKAFLPIAKEGYLLDAHKTNKDGRAIKGKSGKSLSVSHLPHVHRVISLVKRIIEGTHQGSFTEKYIQRYLDEYAFRFDRRDDEGPLPMFQELLARAVRNRCLTHDEVVGRPPLKRSDKLAAKLAALIPHLAGT